MLAIVGWAVWVLVAMCASRALYQALRPNIAGNAHDLYFRIGNTSPVCNIFSLGNVKYSDISDLRPCLARGICGAWTQK